MLLCKTLLDFRQPLGRGRGCTMRTRKRDGEVPVTIVAGFNFDDGLLICADTKHSGTSIHFAPKISAKVYASGAKSAMAFSGRTRYARMTIEDCERAIERISDPTIREMEDEIKDVLIQIHDKHIFRHPDRGVVGGPNFCLMIALWAHGELRLYATEETALDRVHTYECLGAGEYLGRYPQ